MKGFLARVIRWLSRAADTFRFPRKQTWRSDRRTPQHEFVHQVDFDRERVAHILHEHPDLAEDLEELAETLLQIDASAKIRSEEAVAAAHGSRYELAKIELVAAPTLTPEASPRTDSLGRKRLLARSIRPPETPPANGLMTARGEHARDLRSRAEDPNTPPNA